MKHHEKKRSRAGRWQARVKMLTEQEREEELNRRRRNAYAFAERFRRRLGWRLKRLKTAAGLTTYALWQMSGVSRSMLTYIEKGRSNATVHVAARRRMKNDE
ncbi:MAG: helix-turn-helix transcriptional regulator [Verrucomicrobia bacterium]|nr:helix-turn-helix transcriptional regulator [Verrucomicrobiota bacterium]